MALLAGVLLRDLHLHGGVGFLDTGEQWRNRLLRLKVDGAFFGLDNDVGRELAVERMEVVISGEGAVGFQVVVVKMIVVDKSAIENHAAVRSQCVSKHVCRVGGAAMIARGSGLAL